MVPDRELVAHAVRPTSPAEQEAVFTAIYERHADAVLAVCSYLLGEPHDAQNAAHDAFEVAFRSLQDQLPPTEPDKLGAWLRGIARNKCHEHWRRQQREAPMAGIEVETGDEESASRARRAEVDRMLEVVAGSFTEHQHRIFQAVIRDGLVGKQLAARLGVAAEQASRLTHEIITQAYQGFGALVLARDGRPYCPQLAAILDQAAADGGGFTRLLRQRIIRHLDSCERCDNCAACRARRNQLVAPYAPVIIPILVAALLRDRVLDTIRQVCARRRRGGPWPPPGGAPPVPTPRPWPAPPKPSQPHPRHSRQRRRQRRRLVPVGAALVILLLIVGVLRIREASGPPTSSEPLTLTAASNGCPHRTMIYALCFPTNAPIADPGHPLVRRLLDEGEGGVRSVRRRYLVQFAPGSGFFGQLRDPDPLPPDCFDSHNRKLWRLVGAGAVQTVQTAAGPAELGIVPLDPSAAAELEAELHSTLRSCFGMGVAGTGYSMEEAPSPAPVPWMRAFKIRNVGAIPEVSSGGVSWQYSNAGVLDGNYIYVTGFDPAAVAALTAALAEKL